MVGTLKGSLDAWRSRSLEGLEVVYLYLDAIALRVRILLFSLVASGQVKLRRIDGWHNVAHVVSRHAHQIEKAA